MFGAVQSTVLLAIWVVALAIKGYALVDCIRRPAQAFPAVGRQSKPLWLVLTGLALLVGLLPSQTIDLLGIVGLVIALVYVFDVRPRIQAITGR